MGRLLRLILWKKVDRAESRCVLALGVGVTTAREIVRESFINIGRSAAEFVRLDLIAPHVKDLVSIEGAERLDEAISRGKGVLVMVAHIGNWELCGARMEREGYHLVPIYTPQRNTGGLNDFIQHQRIAAAGMTMIPSEGGGMREIFRTLRGGKILVILQDLDARKEGVSVPFFGLPSSAAAGIVRLHAKFGSPVLPILTVRDESLTHHRIIVGDILSDKFDENGNKFGFDVEKSLQMCHNVLEEWIRSYPGQWLWLLDKWESTLG